MDLFSLSLGLISTVTLIWFSPYLRPLLSPFIGSQPLRGAGTSETTAAPRTVAISTSPRRLPRKSRPSPNGNVSTPGSFLQESDATPIGPFKPAIIDVLKLQRYLLQASSNRLPIDLIDDIVDFAEYWPHVSASKHNSLVARGATAYADVLAIRTPPICALATHGSDRDRLGLPEPTRLHPARKIVFTIRSHDQGWSGEESKGTYRNSYTWFDAQIDKQFRPMPGEGRLSDVPWELSSTRFLEEWPRHKHQIDERERREEQGEAEGDAEGEEGQASTQTPGLETRPEPANDPHNTPYDAPDRAQTEDETQGELLQSASSDSLPQVSRSQNPEAAQPRLFSHHYLERHRYEVQHNVQARPETTEHRVEWRWTDNTPSEGPGADALEAAGRGRSTGDGRFVRELRLGDCVSLWAKARHPAWRNHVQGAEVEVYFAL